MVNISTHISYLEATRSDTAKRLGISNDPNAEQLVCMQDVATRIFEAIRAHFCVPIYVSSFFRSSALNKAIGGATSSQHMKGQAMDLDADMFGIITNRQIFDYIKDNLVFDQLIDECIGPDGTGGWVHVSLNGDNNRGEILVMHMEGNKKVYEKYVKSK
jgi:zinc D-Ala-D-Ala carboxypeptidase